VHWIAVLGEDGENVAFAELKWQAANVDIGCVAVVCVPGRVRRDAFLEFEIV
jgi:hypothetical protein